MRVTRSVKKYILSAAVVALIVAVCLIVYEAGRKSNMLPEDYPLNIFSFDVGQGDCELILCEGVSVLIDGGEAEYGRKVEQFLKECGVEQLDCYILTHPHTDHIGVAAHIISAFPVSQIMTTVFSELNMPTTKAYEDMLAAAEKSGAELLNVKGGDVYRYGALKLQILSPLAETDEYNDMSITVRAEYKNTVCLLMGDASANVEAQLLNQGGSLKADLLKVGHHGSSDATSEAFLQAVSPDYAVISCGAGNAFGHPHVQTLNLLNQYGVEVYRTDLNGTVLFYGSGGKLNVRAAA